MLLIKNPLQHSLLQASSPNKEGLLPNETTTEGMNELFGWLFYRFFFVSFMDAFRSFSAKMVWKKLDLIKDPVRLSRLHIEIMNILQMAIAEESSQRR